MNKTRKGKTASLFFIIVILITLSTLSATEQTPVDPIKPRQSVKVIRVIDGDTIQLQNGEKLRYIGIDTPEITGTPDCFSKEAKQKNKELVEGKTVELEKDISETDRYGRLLRYVYVNGIFVNNALVLEGYAKAATYPPDIKHKDLFLQSQQIARTNNKGLWGTTCRNLVK